MSELKEQCTTWTAHTGMSNLVIHLQKNIPSCNPYFYLLTKSLPL